MLSHHPAQLTQWLCVAITEVEQILVSHQFWPITLLPLFALGKKLSLLIPLQLLVPLLATPAYVSSFWVVFSGVATQKKHNLGQRQVPLHISLQWGTQGLCKNEWFLLDCHKQIALQSSYFSFAVSHCCCSAPPFQFYILVTPIKVTFCLSIWLPHFLPF